MNDIINKLSDYSPYIAISLAGINIAFCLWRFMRSGKQNHSNEPKSIQQPSEMVLTIVESLSRPDEWSMGEHTAKHKSGLELWTANGCAHVRIHHPLKGEFVCSDKELIWNALRKMLSRKVIRLLTRGDQ